jgi:Bacterial SH3 domain
MATFGLPGTGLSYRLPLKFKSGSPNPAIPHGGHEVPEVAPRTYFPSDLQPPTLPQSDYPAVSQIRSASVDQLTSASLSSVKQLLITATDRRRVLKAELDDATRRRDRTYRALFRSSHFPLKQLLRRRVPRLQSETDAAQAALEEKAKELAGCYAQLSFELKSELRSAWDLLVKAHDELRRCERLWDITASFANDRVKMRTAAYESVERLPVLLDAVVSDDDLITSAYNAIRFGNANGSALNLYPGICFIRSALGDFALVDMLDIEVSFKSVPFIETEQVPNDSKVIRYAWSKSNKDGTRDLRFANNRQIPVALYGELTIKSRSGLNELYLFSNPTVAAGFADAFNAFKQAQKQTGSVERSAELGPAKPEEESAINEKGISVPDPPSMLGYRVAVAIFSMALVAAVIGVVVDASGHRPERWQIVPLSRETATADQTSNPALPSPSPADRLVPQTPPPAHPSLLSAPISTSPTTSSPEKPVRPTVSAKTTANIRLLPDSSARIVQTAHAGETFSVFDRSKGWIQVGKDKPVGWIAGSLVIE